MNQTLRFYVRAINYHGTTVTILLRVEHRSILSSSFPQFENEGWLVPCFYRRTHDKLLTPLFMKSGGSLPYLQGFFNNLYPEPYQPSSSYLRLGLSNDLFPVDLYVKIWKELLPSSILATWPAHITCIDFTVTILGERYKSGISSLWNLLILLERTYFPRGSAFKSP